MTTWTEQDIDRFMWSLALVTVAAFVLYMLLGADAQAAVAEMVRIETTGE